MPSRNAGDAAVSLAVLQALTQSLRESRRDEHNPLDGSLEVDEQLRVAISAIAPQLAEIESLDALQGLRAGKLLARASCDALHYLIQTAPSLRAAVDCVREFGRLWFDGFVLDVREETGRAYVVVQTADFVPSLLHDLLLSALVHNLLLAEPSLSLDMRTFGWSRPATVLDAPLSQMSTFKCESGLLGISCALEIFNAPRAHCDQRLHAALRQELALRVAALPKVRRWRESVAAAFQGQFAEAPRLDELAEALGISSRALYRRLKAEGTSVKVLFDDARKTQAKWLLTQTDRTLKDIASTLGYHGTAQFHRAFQRWTGDTPTAFRFRQRFQPSG